MDKDLRIYVAGHTGLLGSAIVRELKRQGYNNLILKTKSELDLKDQKSVEEFFEKEKPDYVFLAAAKVGGIKANMDFPAEFIYDNMQMQNNVIHNSWKSGVKKLLFLGSNCIYPKEGRQPFSEDSLLNGRVEETNEAYAIAKIAGIKMCEFYNMQYGTRFITAIPATLFGPNDKFSLERSHFIPALIRKFHEAKIKNEKEVRLWGTGESMREIMYVDDAARACLLLMNDDYSHEVINAGSGIEMPIKDIAEMIKEVVGFSGGIAFDKNKISGVKRKLLDSTKIRLLGWKPETGIREGLEITYSWFKENYSSLNSEK